MSAVCRRNQCGVVMRPHVDHIGRVAVACPACTRNRAGLCRDCPRRLDRRQALRCDRCALARRVRKQSDRDRRKFRDEDTRKAILRQKREYHRRPEVRAQQRAYNATCRAPRIRDDGDRLYHRVWMRDARSDPKWNDRANARRRKLAAARRRSSGYGSALEAING